MRYGILFEVDILHDYFLSLGSQVHESLNDETRAALRRDYSVPAFLEVLPTAATRRRLDGYRLIFKATPAGVRVAVRLDDEAVDDRPAVPIDDDFRLVFSVTVTDRSFHNYSALAESAAGFYYFGNDSANDVAGGIFLSQPVPPFDPNRRYEASEVRAEPSSGAFDLFRSVRDTGPAAAPVALDWERIPADTFDPGTTYTAGAVVLSANQLFRALIDGPGADLTNPAEWQPLGALANQYVTAADARFLRPSVFDLDLSGAALAQATVRLIRPGESQPAWERSFIAESGALEAVQLDLRPLDSGRYRLEVLDATAALVASLGSEIYLDSEGVRQAWLGVIEIGLGSGGLALLDGSGALRSPRYTLRFLNRATRWRYIFPAPQVAGAGAEVAAEAGDPRSLVTAAPRPLTRFGRGVRLQEDLLILLPEPQTQRIRRQSDQWFSEIHTSNLPI